jgi:hypothetical protein
VSAKHSPKDVDLTISSIKLRKYGAHRFHWSRKVGILPILWFRIFIIILSVFIIHISKIAHSLPILVDGFMACD